MAKTLDTVWKKGMTRTATMTQQSFIGAVTGWTCFGLILSAIVASMTTSWHPGLLMYLLVGLGIPIVGIIIAAKSDNWSISALGYRMVVIGLGAISGPTVAIFKTAVVVQALWATAGVTLVMSLVGMMYPKSLEGWRAYLMAGLIALLLVRVAQVVMGAMGVSTGESLLFIDYLAALLFSLFIVYDWNRALRLPYTMDNAVDAALSIYLDIINLFMSLLSIFGASDD